MRQVIARAPTRIDFGGGWTDVPPYTTEQGGCVCNLAITRHASVSVVPAPGRVVVDDEGEVHEAPSAAELPRTGGVELAAAALTRGGLGGVHVGLRSGFPFRAGLGGSSAVGVALAAAVATCRGESISRADLAERSRATEVDGLGIAGGRQDHYASAFGGALGLWFDADVTIRRIALAPPFVSALERRCVLAYTGRSRISGETITAVLDAYRTRDARVVAALARMKILAEQMVDALERASIDELGALVAEHWEHQRALHAKITTPDIDAVMSAARASGAIGGKALGASGGGCVVLIASEDRVLDVRTAVGQLAELLPFTVDREGVDVYQE
ncbi:MAG: hypothetical protein M3081_12915 [Gemmatimonadota bacterium]|nr:hypothetical protein [Gemmatimonadota bacterium]